MYFNPDFRNDFLSWAKSNKASADYGQFDILKQYASFDEIEDKEIYHPYKAKSEKDFVVIPSELLAEDKALTRFAGGCKGIKLLGKYPISFQWPEKRFFCAMEKPRANVFESMASSFMVQNLATYNVIIDRNTNTAYLFTTPAAWEAFKKFYTEYMAKLNKDLEERGKLARQANKVKEEADKAAREAMEKHEAVEKEIFYKADFVNYYKTLE